MAVTLLEKKQRRSAILGELKTLSDAVTLTGGAFTPEQKTKFGSLKTENETLKTEIAVAEEDDANRSYVESLGKELAETTGRKTEPDNLGKGGKQHIGNAKENFEDDPKKGFKNHREFLSEVVRAGRGYEPDKRLKFLLQNDKENLAAGSDEARGISDPAGGFLVPVGFSPDLLKVDPEADPFGALTTKVPMQLPTLRIPARTDKNHSTSVSGGLTVTRRPDTVAGTSSQMTFEQVVLTATSLFGLSYATEELLTDSPLSFVAILEAGFRDQFTYQLIKERLFGTGVGEFLGVANSANPALVSITKETGQAATTFVYENALKMRARCWGYGSAVWVANHDTLPSFALMNQAVGTGGFPVFQPGDRLGLVNSDVGGMFLGRPLIFSEYCQTLGTVGDVVLVNPREFLEGEYQPLQSAESIHVRFVNHERTFKFWMRNDGRPWWRTALTPVNGSNTLSPYVVTATRS